MAYDTDLADRLREVLAGEEGLSEQRMFGGLAFLVHGHMAVAASGQGGLLLRAEPARTDELLGRRHAEAFVMRGRAMDGWLRISPEGVRTTRDLRRWARVGVDYVRTLPPKR
ncbi:MAG: TfoX/Sxy family protein [Acidimicrobiales bacterium]